MPPPIPPVLLPYLSNPPPGSFLLVACVLDAPANWLVVRCILTALHGDRDQNPRPVKHDATKRSTSGRKVVLLSILRPLSLWTELGKKVGLDIPHYIANGQILYVDGLGIYGEDVSPRGPVGTSTLRSHALDEVKNALQRAVEVAYETTRAPAATPDPSSTGVKDTAEGPVLIIDGLDFLIASQPEVTAMSVSQMLAALRQHVHSTTLTTSSDGPLLHGNSAAMTPLGKEHQAFLTSMAHQSHHVMQLRGLDTGTAKDVSGVIRISHGSQYEDNIGVEDLPEGEWLYKVSGDGSVRVWGRGE